MNFTYSMPTSIYFGEDVILSHQEAFEGLGVKALIVTGRRSAKANGSYDDVRKALEYLGVEHVLFDEVEENPSLETIDKASELGKNEEVDFVIGIGGGSPLDAAKAIAVFVKNPQVTSNTVFDQGPLEHLPVVAVATTSGTGSEVTQYSIVTCNKEETKKNLGQSIFPQIAFLDPKYTYDLPYTITVNTAIDAFTHLVEGYLSSQSTPVSEIYGKEGLALFRDCFKNLLEKELSEDFRAKMMYASMLAGIQIAQAGTSLPHGMGYALTYYKGLPHGLANGVLTTAYLGCFKDQEKVGTILNLIGVKDLEELQGILDRLIDIDIDITEEELQIYASSFAENMPKLKNHPEAVGREEILKIYMESLL